MAWVVDTCVIIDVLDGDPTHGEASASCLQEHLTEGLVVSPVSFVELAPAFLGDGERQMQFLSRMGVSFDEAWVWDDTLAAHRAWARYCDLRLSRKIPRRPIADLFIGAFSERFDGLITRNPSDFRPVFPKVALVCPNER